MKRLVTITTAALFLSVCALAQSEVAPGIRLFPGAVVPGTQPDGNSIVFTTKDGLVVMDTGRHVQHTNKILGLAAADKLPIVAIVNSHWHLDHIGGNGVIRHQFPNVKVYASGALADARTGFLANYHRQLEEVVSKSTDTKEQNSYRTEMQLIDSADQLAPDVVIDKAGPRKIGGRDFMVGLETYTVTAGDVWLYDKKSGVLASGDLVTLPAPFLDTACPARWDEALGRLSKIQFKTLIPGHGAPMTHQQFDTYRTAFGQLLQCSASKAEKNVCIDGWLNGVSAFLAPTERDFTKGMMDYYVDVLRQPASATAKLCGQASGAAAH
jgi:glyoxylase-like metal-dependent hydrolase (beta-lactamase superfamily II)